MIFQICKCKWIGISSAKSDEYTIRSIRSDFMNGRVHRNIKCDVSWELESKQNSLNDKSHFYLCISSFPVWCGHLLVRTMTPPPTHPHPTPTHTQTHTHAVKVKTIVTILSMCIMYWHCKAYIVSIGVYSDKTSQRHPGFAARLDHKGTMLYNWPVTNIVLCPVWVWRFQSSDYVPWKLMRCTCKICFNSKDCVVYIRIQ